VINKKEEEIEWFKIIPLVGGNTYAPHVYCYAGDSFSLHLDFYVNQKKQGQIFPSDYKIMVQVIGSETTYVNISGALDTYIIPMNEEIREISTDYQSGSLMINVNGSGTILCINIYDNHAQKKKNRAEKAAKSKRRGY